MNYLDKQTLGRSICSTVCIGILYLLLGYTLGQSALYAATVGILLALQWRFGFMSGVDHALDAVQAALQDKIDEEGETR
jgi:hypothetical protein